MPMFTPMPPLTLRDESDMPMTVRMNAAAHMANRFSYSISKAWMLAMPRCFCLSIYWLSCGVVSISWSLRDMRKSRGSNGMMVSSFWPRVISSRFSLKSRMV